MSPPYGNMRYRNEQFAEQNIANHPFYTKKKNNIVRKIETQAIRLTKISSLGGVLQRQSCADTLHRNVNCWLQLLRWYSRQKHKCAWCACLTT